MELAIKQDDGRIRILKPGKIISQNKLTFLEPVKRTLFEPGTDFEDAAVQWHIIDPPDRPAMALISTYRVDDPNVETRLQWTNEVESGGRYIRPIKPIIEATVGSYARTDPALNEDDLMYDEYKGTQPLATLIADVLDVDEEELQDAYTPDTRFIWSREEWEEALAERVPRYVFYASPGYKAGERKVDYHFVMTQEAFSHASRESREAMLIHGSLVDDDRIFAVMDELERTGSFSLELSLFA